MIADRLRAYGLEPEAVVAHARELEMVNANLAGAHLAGARLAGRFANAANLTGATLAGADLVGTTFANANLTDADLTGADMRKGRLHQANLTRAKLARANLAEARLPSVVALDEKVVSPRIPREPLDARGMDVPAMTPEVLGARGPEIDDAEARAVGQAFGPADPGGDGRVGRGRRA